MLHQAYIGMLLSRQRTHSLRGCFGTLCTIGKIYKRSPPELKRDRAVFSTVVGLVGGLITEAMRGHATVNADHSIEDPKWKFPRWLLHALLRLPIHLHHRSSLEDRIDKSVLSASECQPKATDAKYEACCLSSGTWLLLRDAKHRRR